MALKKINGRLEFGSCSDACFKLGEQCKDRRRGKSRSPVCLRLCDQAIQSEGIAGERPGSPGPAQANVKDVFCSANHCTSDRARILRRLSALAILRISETGPETGFEDCGQTELRKD